MNSREIAFVLNLPLGVPFNGHISRKQPIKPRNLVVLILTHVCGTSWLVSCFYLLCLSQKSLRLND